MPHNVKSWKPGYAWVKCSCKCLPSDLSFYPMPLIVFFILQLCFTVSLLSLDYDCLFFQGSFEDHKRHGCSFPSETSWRIIAILKLCYSIKKAPRCSCRSFIISDEWQIITEMTLLLSAHAMVFSCWIRKVFWYLHFDICCIQLVIQPFITFCITAIRTLRIILILILLLITCFQIAVRGRMHLLRYRLIYDI